MTFENTLIRCSSLSCLFTEPKDKASRERGDLSETAKTHLNEVYISELWGMKKEVKSKPMEKGTEMEEEAITLLSVVDGKWYEKNEEHKKNDYIMGHCDIDNAEDDEIIDSKCSWDAFTFIPHLTCPIDKDYYYQAQGYMWLWNRSKARIAYCLVNTPQSILEGLKYQLLRKMDVVSEESPSFQRELEKLLRNHNFDHIPAELKVICKTVEINQEVLDQIPQKVQKAREYLQQLHELHLKQNLIKTPNY